MKDRKKILVWLTHSFRLNSRLIESIPPGCSVSFVYYSPYYFASEHEKAVYKHTTEFVQWIFASSIGLMSESLSAVGFNFNVFKHVDPTTHMRWLIGKHGFDEIIYDRPAFSDWRAIRWEAIENMVNVTRVDSDLVVPSDLEESSSARLKQILSHVIKKPEAFDPAGKDITPYNFSSHADSSFVVSRGMVDSLSDVLSHGKVTSSNVLTLLHHGVIDARDVLVTSAVDDVPRILVEREANIVRARMMDLSLEDDPLQWMKKVDFKGYRKIVEVKANQPFDGHSVFPNTSDINQMALMCDVHKPDSMADLVRLALERSPDKRTALKSVMHILDAVKPDGQSPAQYFSVCEAFSKMVS